jgi:glycopeptide antibiotics resistance protein
MKRDENEPNPGLVVFGKAMVIFFIIFVIYLSTTKTKSDWMSKTIIFDVIVIYALCIIGYNHFKYRDKR